MSDSEKNLMDFETTDIKMPEENFLGGSVPVAKKKSALPVLLILIIIMLTGVLAGLLWWAYELLKVETPTEVIPDVVRPTPEENNEPESTKAEAEVETIQAISSSDELPDIKADLDATNIKDLDSELQTIELFLIQNVVKQ
jgi:cytoskeletal protein RodZ